MQSRLLTSIWLSLLLLFSQQSAFADSLMHAHYSVSDDHQYAFEDASFDGDAGKHIALGDFNGLPAASFALSVLSNLVIMPVPEGIDRFFSAVSSYYSSRAPPLL